MSSEGLTAKNVESFAGLLLWRVASQMASRQEGGDSKPASESGTVVIAVAGGATPSDSAAAPAPAQSAVAAALASHGPGGGLNLSSGAMTAIAFWLCMSCSVILFNKYLYSTSFPHPLTLTSIQ